MRHERITARNASDDVDIATIWPAGLQLAPIATPDTPPADKVFRSAPAAPDIPAAVGRLIVAAYVALIAAFALATAGSRESIFMITIAALFIVTFFTVPWIILGMEPSDGARPSFDRFLREGLQTYTGHCTGKAALIQILIVPVFLTFGVLAMGIAAAFLK